MRPELFNAVFLGRLLDDQPDGPVAQRFRMDLPLEADRRRKRLGRVERDVAKKREEAAFELVL
jgi:hypothetical protein